MTSFIPIVFLDSNDFIHTSSGNIISRKCIMKKPQSIELPGGRCIIMGNTTLDGDCAVIKIEKYCFIDENTMLQPGKIIVPVLKYISLTIGAYTTIGKGCIIESACIGTGCRIGNNCKLYSRSILKDYVHVEDNTVIPEDIVIPPFAIVSGIPCRIIGYVSESVTTTARNVALIRYKSYTLT